MDVVEAWAQLSPYRIVNTVSLPGKDLNVTDDPFAGVVLDMLSETLHRLTTVGSADDVPLRHLSRALQADAAVTLAAGPGAHLTVCAAEPDLEQASALSARVLQLLDSQALPHFEVHQDPRLGTVAVVSMFGDAVDAESRDHARVLAFARREPFGSSDKMLLERACRPLAALWPHAARATRAFQAGQVARVLAEGPQMTDRELEVLRLLAEGRLATSIAIRLSLSPRTVHKHLGNIYRKLGVHDRLVAVSLARIKGLLPEDPDSSDNPPRP